jgi:hypothetical protein
MHCDQSGRVGVPLPPCVAYGSWVVDAVQQSAVEAGGAGRAAGHCGAMREVMIYLERWRPLQIFGIIKEPGCISNESTQRCTIKVGLGGESRTGRRSCCFLLSNKRRITARSRRRD